MTIGSMVIFPNYHEADRHLEYTDTFAGFFTYLK